MNFPGSQYYRVNRILLQSLGLWPYEKPVFRYIHITIFEIAILSGLVVQLTPLATTDYDLDVFLKIFSFAVPWFNYGLKYFTIAIQSENIRKVLDYIQDSWTPHTRDEREILVKYSTQSHRFTVICALLTCGTAISFVLMMLMPDFLDRVKPLNASRSHSLPVVVEYFVDLDAYFGLILLHLTTVMTIGLTIVVATETAILQYIHHASGLFEIACYRFHCALNEERLQSPHTRSSIIYAEVLSSIKIYMEATEFCHLMKRTFIPSYIALMPLGVLTLSVNLYRLSEMDMNDVSEFYLTATFVFAHFGYFYLGNYMGQMYIDQSLMLSTKTYETDWYAAPLRIQKLMLLLLQRTMKPDSCSICNLYVASIESFVPLVSTSVSYFTLIRSLK